MTEDISADSNALTDLERSIRLALETYSNVHRGSGYNSTVTTSLFEQAREIVLKHLGLSSRRYAVVFCTHRRAAMLTRQIDSQKYTLLSSRDIGLFLGVTALAVQKNALPQGIPFQTGGGTARLISKEWVVWAKGSAKFEAGTPAIINIIAFAKALRMIELSGIETFRNLLPSEHATVSEIFYHDDLDELSGRELLVALQSTLIGRGAVVPTMHGITPFINMDNSASTRTFTPVWNAFRQSWRQSGQSGQSIVQEVKSICSKHVNAPLADYEVVFTSNATEAINLAAESFSREMNRDCEAVVVSTLLEHSSNDLPWRAIPNCSLLRLNVDAEGGIDATELEKLFISYNQDQQHGTKRITLVAVSGASNVLGRCTDLELIGGIAHRFGARIFVDGSQLVVHRKIDMNALGLDYLAFSAHKVYAPFGCGVLVVRKDLLQFTQDERDEITSSGEENIGGIAALGKALVLLQRIGMSVIGDEERALTRLALRGMAEIDGLKVYGMRDADAPGFANKLGVIPFALKNKFATQVATELSSMGGIGVRSGCHCAHMIVKHTLGVGPRLEKFQRMIVTLFPRVALPGVVRVSLGIENTSEEITQLIRALKEIASPSLSKPDGPSTVNTQANPRLKQKNVKQQIQEYVEAASRRIYG